MSTDIWDEFTTTGDWITFNEIGDSVVGTVTVVRRGKDFNGNPCPELVIDVDGQGEKTLTAGQVMLKSALAEQRPGPGDRIAIVYSGVGDAKPGKAPAKLFDVTVRRAGQPDPSPTQPAAGVSADDLI